MPLNAALTPLISGSANSSLVAAGEEAAELHELQLELLPYFEAPYWGVPFTYVWSMTRVLTLCLYRFAGSDLVRSDDHSRC
jgi:hypothetical protein